MVEASGAYVCPSEDVLLLLPETADFELVARNAQSYWIYENGKWRWISSFPDRRSVVLAVNRLKYALGSHKVHVILELCGEAMQSRFQGMTAQEFSQDAALNDLYAAMSFNHELWYRQEGMEAVFEFPGWTVSFKWQEDQWKLMSLQRHGF